MGVAVREMAAASKINIVCCTINVQGLRIRIGELELLFAERALDALCIFEHCLCQEEILNYRNILFLSAVSLPLQNLSPMRWGCC